jgi:hypothetical protein
MYVTPAIANPLSIDTHGFMPVVGVVEIIAGLLVAIKPRFGAGPSQ